MILDVTCVVALSRRTGRTYTEHANRNARPWKTTEDDDPSLEEFRVRYELGSKCYCDGRWTLLVCLYASPWFSLQVLDLERRELLTMDATDQSPVLLLLFALRPSLCCVQKAIL